MVSDSSPGYPRKHPEEVAMAWREEFPDAYLALGYEMGLVRFVTYEHTGDRIYPAETDPATRDPEYVTDVMDALKCLIEIDPDMRR